MFRKLLALGATGGTISYAATLMKRSSPKFDCYECLLAPVDSQNVHGHLVIEKVKNSDHYYVHGKIYNLLKKDRKNGIFIDVKNKPFLIHTVETEVEEPVKVKRHDTVKSQIEFIPDLIESELVIQSKDTREKLAKGIVKHKI